MYVVCLYKAQVSGERLQSSGIELSLQLVFAVKLFGQNLVEYFDYQWSKRAKCVFVLQELSLLVRGITTINILR